MISLTLTRDYLLDLMVRMAHHSTAIEGNSLTLANTISILLEKYVPVAASLREVHEIENYEGFMATLIDSLKSGEPICLDLIKKFHKKLCVNAIQGESGVFKKVENMIVGADFDTSKPYMVIQDLTQWVDDANFLFENCKSEQDFFSALAGLHIRFERIHPFSDGNGRVGRALVVFACMSNGMAPSVVVKEDRSKYIELLRKENVAGLAEYFCGLSRFEAERIEKFRGNGFPIMELKERGLPGVKRPAEH